MNAACIANNHFQHIAHPQQCTGVMITSLPSMPLTIVQNIPFTIGDGEDAFVCFINQIVGDKCPNIYEGIEIARLVPTRTLVQR